MLSDPLQPPGDAILEDLPFSFYLARAGLNFRRFNDRTLRAVGLKLQPPGLASVLHALEEQEDCTVSSLVKRTDLPNGTRTGLLDSLEAAAAFGAPSIRRTAAPGAFVRSASAPVCRSEIPATFAHR